MERKIKRHMPAQPQIHINSSRTDLYIRRVAWDHRWPFSRSCICRSLTAHHSQNFSTHSDMVPTLPAWFAPIRHPARQSLRRKVPHQQGRGRCLPIVRHLDLCRARSRLLFMCEGTVWVALLSRTRMISSTIGQQHTMPRDHRVSSCSNDLCKCARETTNSRRSLRLVP